MYVVQRRRWCGGGMFSCWKCIAHLVNEEVLDHERWWEGMYELLFSFFTFIAIQSGCYIANFCNLPVVPLVKKCVSPLQHYYLLSYIPLLSCIVGQVVYRRRIRNTVSWWNQTRFRRYEQHWVFYMNPSLLQAHHTAFLLFQRIKNHNNNPSR